MRVVRSLLISLSFIASCAFAQELPNDAPKQKQDYQSDVARLRRIVINSLYSHRDVFLRELVSNANDALEKLRLTALTDKQVWDGSEPLNITIKAIPDEDGKGGRVVITDTGIGMSPEELSANLGTLAKSGTTEFLQKAESNTDSTGTGNLIGAFGLGFYSSFLVADRVYVASIPPRTDKNPNPVQHVFSSNAEESSFEVYRDPRGNTLGRGTEITLVLKDDANEYLDAKRLEELVSKHSSFSTSFPIYLFTQRTEEVPDEEAQPEEVKTAEESKPEDSPADETAGDEDEVIVEEEEDTKEPEKKEVKMKTVTVDEWLHLNSNPPLWVRDPKTITEEEYERFYEATFRDYEKPLAWHHFSGDSGSGVSFKAIIFVPSHLEEKFWQQTPTSHSRDVRLMVKRVFITNNLGDEPLPKWASWVKVIIDADDLPLNVSRETLQSSKFLRQIRQIILKRIITLFSKLAEDNPEKFEKLQSVYGTVIKLGAVESTSNREKLAGLARFTTNQRNLTSLDQYVENRKKGQKQIFYLADLGKTPEFLKKSVFVEKLHARGYEVLLLNEPLDEILLQNLRQWKGMTFQDVAKAGLKFGDEDMSPEEEKRQQQELKEKFQPLLTWLKDQAGDVVRSVVVSNRLVVSPCAIVADEYGYTANIEKLISASTKGQKQNDFMSEFAKKQKILEINPKSPLIEGLLRRIEQLPTDEDERDVESEEELKEVASILIDGALVRSGFEVPDSNEFFARVDRVLRRSLGVSEHAKTDATVEPAPEVDPNPPEPVEEPSYVDASGRGKIRMEDMLGDAFQQQFKVEMEEIPEDDPIHDEL